MHLVRGLASAELVVFAIVHIWSRAAYCRLRRWACRPAQSVASCLASRWRGQHRGRLTFILSQPIAVPSHRRAPGGPPAPAAQPPHLDDAGWLETGVPATSLPDHAVLIGTLAVQAFPHGQPVRARSDGRCSTSAGSLPWFLCFAMKLGFASRAAADLKPQAVEAGLPRAH